MTDIQTVLDVAEQLNAAGDGAAGEQPPEPEWFDKRAAELRGAVQGVELREMPDSDLHERLGRLERTRHRIAGELGDIMEELERREE